MPIPTGPTKPAHNPRSNTRSREEKLVLAVLLLTGGLPWVGLLVRGQWDQTELGIATLVLVFALRCLFFDKPRGGPKPPRGTESENTFGRRAADDPSRPYQRTLWTPHT